MIGRKEIATLAKQSGVPPDTIDKDFVLGHFLNAFFNEPWAKQNFIFKGGTCLRKCYFENYRFSEDVDMTILDDSFQLSRKHMENVLKVMESTADIPTKIFRFDEVIFQNRNVGWDIEICYWGANHNPSDTPVFRSVCHTKIWCEFRFFEQILFPKSEKKLIHSYSDAHLLNVTIPCYHVHEVLSEKLRALIQRNRGEARDYYDLWYLKNNIDTIDWQQVKEAFFQKCGYKNIPFNHVSDFFVPVRLQQVEITWEKRLNHQLTQKVDRIAVLTELQVFLTQLFQ